MAEVVTFANTKPGTGKSTTATWFAHACHEAGEEVTLVDADPGGSRSGTNGSTFRWSEVLGNPERDGGPAPFPFPCLPMPSNTLHKTGPQIVGGARKILVDAPQLEDRAPITRSAMLWSTTLIIPVAPAPVEIERMGWMAQELEDLALYLPDGHQVYVLLNRVAPRASTRRERAELAEAGWTVLDTEIQARVEYQRSWGEPIYDAADTEFGDLREELEKRRAAR